MTQLKAAPSWGGPYNSGAEQGVSRVISRLKESQVFGNVLEELMPAGVGHRWIAQDGFLRYSPQATSKLLG